MTEPPKLIRNRPRKPRVRWRVTRWDGDGHPPRTVATFGSRTHALQTWAARQKAEPSRWFFIVKAAPNA